MSTVTLSSDRASGRGVPTAGLGRVLVDLQEAVRGAIAMALCGQSLKADDGTSWLDDAADIRLGVMAEEPCLTLEMDIPVLTAALAACGVEAEIVDGNLTHPEETGFDLLGDVLRDIAAGRDDSDRFDADLLERIEALAADVGEGFRELRIEGVRRPSLIAARMAEQARAIRERIPPPQAAMLVGTLDSIQPDPGSFRLKVEGDVNVRCIPRGDEIAGLAAMLGRPVLVSGRCVFRASGIPLRMEADEVRPATEADAYFARLPRPNRRAADLGHILHEQRHRGGVAAILGRWPGDETDEEIEEWLKATT